MILTYLIGKYAVLWVTNTTGICFSNATTMHADTTSQHLADFGNY